MRTKKGVDVVPFAILGLILLGYLSRVWRIGYQSLWLDEALSVAFAGVPLSRILANLTSQDIHPPLYYVLLHFWMSVAGTGEFSVRFLSVALGLPSVPATYMLARALFPGGRPASHSGGAQTGRRPDDRASAIGLGGAFLVAFSPFLVYYSQEARMYSALVTFSVLSSYALWKYVSSLRPRWLVVYVVFTAALIYTQYFGGLVVLFHVVYLLGLLTRRRGAAFRGLVGVGLVGVCYLPWVPSAFSQMERMFHTPDFWKGQLSLSFLLEHVFAAFALGQYPALGRYLPVALVAALVLVAGLALLARRAFASGGGELYLLIYLVVPFGILYAILARNPKFTERYLIMIAPAFYLVFALALVDVIRWIDRRLKGTARLVGLIAPLGVAIVFLAASFSQLWQVYYGPGYRKEDNRGAASYISQHYQPGDVVILMMDPYSFPYYTHGTIPATPLQPGDNMLAGANSLNRILAGHTRAWLLLWNADFADPTGFVRNALESTYPETPVEQFNGLGLKLFTIDRPPHFAVRTTPEHPESVNFGNRLLLLGYDLPSTTVSAGQTGDITLYWKPTRLLDNDYIVSLRLTDGRFYYWRHDRRPAAETFPTTNWSTGQVVAGDLPFDVPVGTPPGNYALEVGVYGQGAGGDLDVLKDGNIPLGTSTVVAHITVNASSAQADPAKLVIPNRNDVTMASNLRLLGSSLDSSKTPPGGSIGVTLWWQSHSASLPDYRVQMTLVNGNYRQVVLDEPPDAGTYPTSRWKNGEIVTDKHRFTVPADAPAGPSRIRLSVAPSENGAPDTTSGDPVVDIGTVDVLNRPIELTPPADVENPVNWTFGAFANLVGYSLSTTSAHPGDHLLLTLYWKAVGNSGDVGYTVFSHLLDQHNIIAAQQDHPPADGANPTSGWISGEYIADHYNLTIKSDAAPGTYHLEIGLYNPANGARVPVHGKSGENDSDRVILATVQVR